VLDRLATPARGLEQDAQVFADLLLADVFGEQSLCLYCLDQDCN